MKQLTPFLFALLLIVPFESQAQQRATAYESLLQRSDQPSSYISHAVLPAETDSATVAVLFRLDYDLVPFLRVRESELPSPENAQYFAPFQMGLEIFEGKKASSRRNSTQGRSVFRDSYEDTIYVKSFEETRSRQQHIEGFITTELTSGVYNYELQLQRAQSTRQQSSTRRNMFVPRYDTLSSAGMILMDHFQQNGSTASGTFLNYGENVLYGSDYELLAVLPKQADESEYNLSVHKMTSGTSDKAESAPVYSESITSREIFNASDYRIQKRGQNIELTMDIGDGGTRYGLFSVPNSEFENARYRLQIEDGSGKVIAKRIVNSRWLDMPVSLLNVDVAIDMLKFIVSEEELERLKSGSDVEKEQKFRAFWDQRDPSPEIEFNELMAEYYNRIDYAYRNFSSMQIPGYESDRGKAYILYGEPDSTTRRFPTDQPTLEVWEYPDKTLVFEATSGFGEFRLISER